MGMGRAASYRARGAYSGWRRLNRALGPSTGWALGLRPLSGLELLEKPGLGLWCIGFVVVGLRGPGGGVCHLAKNFAQDPSISTLSESRFPEQNGSFGLGNFWDLVVLWASQIPRF